jgi:hypothetical protein
MKLKKTASLTALFLLIVALPAVYAGPMPVSDTGITVSYMAESGMVTINDTRGYTGGPPVDLGGNVKMFNSAGNTQFSFGRRTSLLQFPEHAGVLRPGETLLAHAFFKQDEYGDFFPGIMHDSDVRIRIENVQFSEPVTVQQDTLLFHTLWLSDQSDELDNFYHHVHNIHTLNDPFRDEANFAAPPAHLFATSPDNFVLGQSEIDYTITGNGTSALTFEFTLPYVLLMNLEEMHHQNHHIPHGLPAPHGFLEPFHFHFEYAVVPEPATMILLLPAVAVALARRRNR